MGTAIKVAEASDVTRTAVDEYAAPAIVREQALIKDWAGERDRFQKDPDASWAEVAGQFAWTNPWEKVFEWDGIRHKWFT